MTDWPPVEEREAEPLPPEVRTAIMGLLAYAKDAVRKQLIDKRRLTTADVLAWEQLKIVEKYLA